MAEKGKAKKVEPRDIWRNKVAQLIMEDMGLGEIGRTKEGILVRDGDQDIIIKVIQKKDKVEAKDIVETIPFFGEEEAE